MKGHRDFNLRRKAKPLSSECLARILRGTTVERDAAETFERLTGKKIPESQEGNKDEAFSLFEGQKEYTKEERELYKSVLLSKSKPVGINVDDFFG